MVPFLPGRKRHFRRLELALLFSSAGETVVMVVWVAVEAGRIVSVGTGVALGGNVSVGVTGLARIDRQSE